MLWTDERKEPALFEFQSARNLHLLPRSRLDPFGYFLLFFPPTYVDLIIHQTNEYAKQLVEDKKKSKKLLPNSRINSWSPLDRPEFFTFLGLIILMGVKSQPTIESYWSTDPKLYNPIFHKIMPRNRFQEILRCLHFVDNKKEKKTKN